MERCGPTARACLCLSNTEAKAAAIDRDSISRLVARVHKDRDRSDGENGREDDATVAINFLGALRLLLVLEDRRYQDFDQGKENQQSADEKKKVDSRHVRQTRQLAINGETIGNQSKHRCNRDADLRV